MPITSVQDTRDVENTLDNILNETDSQARIRQIRSLFEEKLDFGRADQLVSLAPAGNDQLPADAHLVARRAGVTVAYIPLDNAATNRVTAAVAIAAGRVLAQALTDQLLLLFSNRDGDQLHIISPDLTGSRPKLQRLVAYRGQVQRTVPQQIANLWHSYGVQGKTMGQAIEEAFSVEPVTKEFFQTYRDIFNQAKSEIGGFGSGNEEQETRHVFTQTLFNRLMFVYFLSRKGWLKFKDNTDYLNALWSDYGLLEGDRNFYTARLNPLFFAGLNNSQSRNLTSNNDGVIPVIGHVPFLNGGLFEETDLDKRQGITVPDDVVKRILTGLFDRFNFTVMESTPFDIEVAVDPEMLGKVFEELVTERHASGAYYTPRPVVSFMCREALKGYLEGKQTGASPEAIAAFVDRHDTDGIGVAEARRISLALSEVTVVDPACGSGAYLLGMMQELIELQNTLYNVGVDAKSLYDLKLEIIQRNLYGVDIDDFAVNIAMLRLWLSLAIDYEGDDPQPLPNLDFKVLCGDSLLGPDPSAGVEVQGTLGQEVEQFRRLGGLKGEYMRASLGSDKERLKGQIEETEAAVRDALGVSFQPGVVDWRVALGEIFAESKGFNIAIANPPYVRQENIGPQKQVLLEQYAAAVVARSDLYCYFYARCLQLLKDGGTHVFVCSNSWLDVGYGAQLQQHLLRCTHIQAVYESAVERQFATADINTIISIMRKANIIDNGDVTRFVSLRAEFETSLDEPDSRREIAMTRAQIRDAGLAPPDNRGRRKFVGDKWGGKYLRSPDIYHHILDKYADKLLRLGEVARIRRGITTGANDFFYLSQTEIQHWNIEQEFCLPAMTTPQESRSIAVDLDNLPKRIFMCHKDKEELKGTGALAYIQQGEKEGFHFGNTMASRRRWYDLGEKPLSHLLVSKMIDTTSHTFIIEQGVYANNVLYDIHSALVTPERICAATNSTTCQLFFNVEGRTNFGGGMLELAAYELANIPLVNPALLPEPDIAVFNSAAWDVLTPSAARREIDGIVFGRPGPDCRRTGCGV